MLTDKIKAMLLPRLIRQAVKSGAVVKPSGSGRLGLIIDAAVVEDQPEFLNFYKMAGYESSNFNMVVCGSRQNLNPATCPVVLDDREIGLSGKMESGYVEEFLEKEFDFLICYFSGASMPGNLLAARSKAAVKIGRAPDEFGIFDVEIQAGNVEIFQQEALKYLEILKRNT